jgi:hypothetical protein
MYRLRTPRPRSPSYHWRANRFGAAQQLVHLLDNGLRDGRRRAVSGQERGSRDGTTEENSQPDIVVERHHRLKQRGDAFLVFGSTA